MFFEALKKVPALREDDAVNVFVETPTGSRDKFDLDHDSGLFTWSLQLPLGSTFPFSFGFVPNTLAEDGDPLDIILLVDGCMPQGVVVQSRLIGVLPVTQDDAGDGELGTRNDRILAVPTMAQSFGDAHDIGDLRTGLYEEIGAFFASYNRLISRKFEYGDPLGADEACRRLDEAIDRFRQQA